MYAPAFQVSPTTAVFIFGIFLSLWDLFQIPWWSQIPCCKSQKINDSHCHLPISSNSYTGGILPCLPAPPWDLWWEEDHFPCNPGKGEDPWSSMEIHCSNPILRFNSKQRKPRKAKRVLQSYPELVLGLLTPNAGLFSLNHTSYLKSVHVGVLLFNILVFQCYNLLGKFGIRPVFYFCFVLMFCLLIWMIGTDTAASVQSNVFSEDELPFQILDCHYGNEKSL